MKQCWMLTVAILLGAAGVAWAQEPVTPNPDHATMLASDDPQLAANKRLVYDMWREVLEAGHFELAEKYIAEDYIQHNPNAVSGRAAMVEFLSKMRQKQPIKERIEFPLVSIVAERDLVVLTFAREYEDPADASRTYTTTWLDMFRIENGKIVEHWDSARKGDY